MKKLSAILIIALSLASLTSCIRKASDVFGDEKGSMNAVTKTIAVADYDDIQFSGGNVEIYYTQSDTTSLKVEAPERFLNRLKVENEDGTLAIRFEGAPGGGSRYVSLSGKSGNEGQYLKVYASSKTLRKIGISGAGDFICKKPLQTDQLSMHISGAGDIVFADVTAERIEASISGAGDISLLARKADIDLSIAGAGDIEGTLKDCGNVRTSIAGAGDIRLKGNAQHADNFVSGGASIDISELSIADRQ